MAPELMRTRKATTCTDVYAFGVFMLEVACRKRPLDDPQLEGVFAEDEMKLVLKLGLFCCFRNPVGRPTMRQVMQYLDGDVVLPDVPSTSNITSLCTANDEAPDNEVEMPFPSLFGNAFVAAVSTTDSILVVGR
ncbi:hypothetical protein Pint_26088 [Pistacia integerrima]|uniref:Uncharacterized protein n=1 Tax=Pistacia integerrima TaxID=434235 RepID=A0ACC0YIP2_9ROSI|nr:hypothetical protein Pint_26088 [Pistacia integerrima]